MYKEMEGIYFSNVSTRIINRILNVPVNESQIFMGIIFSPF